MAGAPRPRVRHGDGDVLQFRIELDGVAPLVWRRVAVSSRASLHEFHGVIQSVLGHDPEASYRLEVDGVTYRDPSDEPTPGHAADEVALEDLGLHVGAMALHTVDTLDEPWLHRLVLEQSAPRLVGQRLPVCLAAGRAAPPDDCDGPGDYRAMLAALASPLDPRAADLRTWLPEEFDPGYADVVAINASLAKLPKHRPAA